MTTPSFATSLSCPDLDPHSRTHLGVTYLPVLNYKLLGGRDQTWCDTLFLVLITVHGILSGFCQCRMNGRDKRRENLIRNATLTKNRQQEVETGIAEVKYCLETGEKSVSSR